jgi:hypothetical protein
VCVRRKRVVKLVIVRYEMLSKSQAEIRQKCRAARILCRASRVTLNIRALVVLLGNLTTLAEAIATLVGNNYIEVDKK